MNLNRIATKTSLIFLGFAVLVLVSVGLTFWGLNTQKEEAVVINLAGRQRMLVQQIRRLALEMEGGKEPGTRDQLQQSRQTFEQTLNALRNGGEAPYFGDNTVVLPRTQSPEIVSQIDQISQTWRTFAASLDVIETAAPGSPDFSEALQSLENTAPGLVTQVDELVRLYENQSTNRVATLRSVQALFLGSALALLIAGVWGTRRFILHPLQALGQAAQRFGSGDLETPVQVRGDAEIEVLNTTMEEMRRKLRGSKQELQTWANTLEERVTQRTQELEALNSVSREISSRLEIQHVLNSVVEKSRQLLKADVAFLCLLDAAENRLNLQSNSGTSQAVIACSASAKAGWASQVIAGEQALRCEPGGCQGYCQIVASPYRQSHLAAPLCIDNHPIGALCVASQQPEFFNEEAAGLLTRLANIASVAIENARLYAQTERSAAIEERHRIAAEMHDGLAQTLSFLSMTLDQTQRHLESGDLPRVKTTLERAQHGVDLASHDIRRAIDSLQEDLPAQFTIQEQLDSLIQEMDRGRPPVVWENRTPVPLIMKPQDAEQVLRVVREAVINAQKHSRANQIRVTLQRSNNTGTISIEDDGTGFDPQALPASDRPHFGLKIMQARAAQVRGKLEIQAEAGKGTRVVLTWPVEQEEPYGEDARLISG